LTRVDQRQTDAAAESTPHARTPERLARRGRPPARGRARVGRGARRGAV